MGKIIIVASGKGGTGKTTVTANIGAALAMRGNLVALVDMDMGCRNLDITLGLESSIVYDIFDVIEENCDLDEALIKDTRYENLYFIPAPQTRDTSSVEDEAVKGIWEKLSSRFDYCLVDAPAGIDGGFLYAAMGADSAILVTMPEVTALRDGDRAISVHDPFIGIMHVDNYNRQSFVFDLIEMYRIYIDQIVFKLFSSKKIKTDYFDKVEGGLYLNKAGKEVLIGKYNEEMEKKITYKGRKIELQNIIQYDCHNIANRILKEG